MACIGSLMISKFAFVQPVHMQYSVRLILVTMCMWIENSIWHSELQSIQWRKCKNSATLLSANKYTNNICTVSAMNILNQNFRSNFLCALFRSLCFSFRAFDVFNLHDQLEPHSNCEIRRNYFKTATKSRLIYNICVLRLNYIAQITLIAFMPSWKCKNIVFFWSKMQTF